MKHRFLLIILIALFLLPGIASGAEINCPKCNSVNDSEAQFCGACGAILLHPKTPEVAQPSRLQESPIPDPGALDPSVQQLIGQLSEEDLRRIVVIMLKRLESQQARYAPPPNSVGMMTREELEDLLRNYSKQVQVKKEASGFGSFLQFIGGGVLFIVALMLIASF